MRRIKVGERHNWLDRTRSLSQTVHEQKLEEEVGVIKPKSIKKIKLVDCNDCRYWITDEIRNDKKYGHCPRLRKCLGLEK